MISSVAFSANSQYIVSGSLDDTIKVVSQYGEQNANFQHSAQVDSIAFSRDGKYLVSGSKDGTMRVWDLKGKGISISNDKKSFVGDFSQDGKYFISGSEDGIVQWDQQGNIIQTFKEKVGKINFITFTPDDKYVVSGSYDGEDGTVWVRFWDREGKLIRRPFPIGESRILGLSSQGHIVSVGKDGTVQLWDQFGNRFGEGFKISDITDYDSFSNLISLSPNGKIIVTSESVYKDDKYISTVRLRDSKGNQIAKPFQISSEVTSIALSPDGKKIITGNHNSNSFRSERYTVQLWNLKGNRIGEPFQGHFDRIHSVAFTPDGQYAVSKSDCFTLCSSSLIDQSLRLWDLEGNPIGNPLDMDSNNFLINPDGKYIANSEGTLFPGNWQAGLEVACDRLRYHPVLLEAKTDEAKGARETCQKYVW